MAVLPGSLGKVAEALSTLGGSQGAVVFCEMRNRLSCRLSGRGCNGEVVLHIVRVLGASGPHEFHNLFRK